MIEVELFDGTVLEFPEGTSQDVINRRAKLETQARKGTAATTATGKAPAATVPASTAPVARSPADASPTSTAPVVIASTPPRIDETATAPAPSERPPLREQFSREYFETAGRAAGGLAGGEGVVDLSGSVPVYREGGAEASIPTPVLPVAEYLGDVLMTAASAGGGAYGYLAGGLGDLLEIGRAHV